ncbi:MULTISPECIES: PAS-domain containing protein [unclassified Stenotrophomonas]|uniref:hybrid sensor histidine kinase/response regulator n=1 Tax=unclassified Stenotrophomonas TaxID=196198 RepID=UPI00244BA573|nr:MULTISPECIES: PAS-domain containing protein [unclassified Stenotrophomonas]MBN5157887.1 PAS-domain containing protein [Stenotrophomonas maltophilia]MDG9842063.1 PAS-domain containing protein [Stenotrophomonas sp. GD04054]MDH0015495.1 PAS-domain containing protein [Stenotrophomonas sp. GD04028]MDH0574584.1 PAS-domain containing protein [Stenotrophomonas sp. GD03997]MDH0858654.1 PAS-domain containing protein [Stenotrophomonas sp. GD03882]
MLTPSIVLFACIAWTALLFGVALWGERRGHRLSKAWPLIYALSLAVHCTAWTYYGAASQGLQWGFPIPPTLAGMALIFAFGLPFLLRLGRLAKQHNSATIADLVVARLRADRGLGFTITLVALFGIIPYIALQLKAVSQGLGALLGDRFAPAAVQLDMSFWFALTMAAFTLLFGARKASATEPNRGIVVALGLESVLKLVALLAIGLYAALSVRQAGTPLLEKMAQLPPPAIMPDYLTMVALGAISAFTLPHQFHVGVVELRQTSDLRTARWLFPVYLLLIGLPSVPMALAGAAQLPASVSPDLYVLALPQAGGHHLLALLAYLGSLSAATGMMILSGLTLSIMLGNHGFGSRLLDGIAGGAAAADLRPRVLAFRRAGILAVFLMSWLYSRAMSDTEALSDFGLMSFTALSQLAPAVLLAVYRPRTPSPAIIAGIVLGSLAWLWLVLLPMVIPATPPASGPDDLHWLSVVSLRLQSGHIAISMGASLAVNLLTVALVSRAVRPSLPRRRDAVAAASLRRTAGRFLGQERARQLMDGHAGQLLDDDRVITIERELSAVVGAGMARLLVEAARDGGAAPLDAVTRAVGEATQALRFNQRLLEAALENMSQGISVVDAQLQLVAWNSRYAALFKFPPELLQVGQPVVNLTAWALAELKIGDGPGDSRDKALQRRAAHMRRGTPHLSERIFPDNTIVEIRGNPMPGGGYVATFTDVTAFRRAEEALKRSNETLERRVQDRTARLEQAVHEAERANVAKTRFLTAVGHDLIQPLHAAQLLTDAMSQHIESEFLDSFLRQIRGALDSTDDLLSGLLDISRLEAGGLVADPRPFALSTVLDPLAQEFAVLAAARGLQFRQVRSQAWVHSDPLLLRRVLQNFLANAIRYTCHGGVLLGVRRQGQALLIGVHDTGPGIAPEQQAVVFEEFHRVDRSNGQGLGLGLTIAHRIADLLHAPLHLRSVPEHGSAFSISVQRAAPPATPRSSPPAAGSSALKGVRVLVVDNDPDALEAMRQLLLSWGCDVIAAGQADDIGPSAHEAALWLFDYHLDDGDTGVALWKRLVGMHGPRPTVILSADAGSETREAVRGVGLSLLNKPFKPLALRWAINHLLAASTTP